MVHFHDEIPDDPKLFEWIKAQYMFHVATAPLKGAHVNVSPKGQQSFKLVNRKACWYLDLTGSGNETISHLYEPGNGRLTIMFEAFQGPPRILRFWGKGRVFERGSPEFERLMSEGESEVGFPTPQMLPGARAIIWLDIARVGTSCGYAVPYMKFEAHRNILNDRMDVREKNDVKTADPFVLTPAKGLQSYWTSMNTWSVDGLPGMRNIAHKVTRDRIREAVEGCGLGMAAIDRANGMPTWALPLLIGVMIGLLLALIPQYSLYLSYRSSLSHVCIANYCL